MISLNIQHLFFPPQRYILPCLNSELLAQREKKAEAAAAMLRWN